jgi:hypothetical protein
MGVIIQVYSIEFWVIKSYHPLRDTTFIFILLGSKNYDNFVLKIESF